MKFLVTLFFWGLHTVALAIPIDARIYDHKSYSGSLVINLDGKEVAKLELSGSDRWINIPKFEYRIGRKLTVSGSFKPEQGFLKFAKKGDSAFTFLDIGPVFAPLRNTKQSFSKSWGEFLNAKDKFEKDNAIALDEAKLYIMTGDKNTQEEITAAEKRLGYALPEDYKDMLLSYGAPMIDDSHFTTSADIDNAFKQMNLMWGSPVEELEKYSEEMKRFLKESVIIFTESGDGYGAVIYKPIDSVNQFGEAGYYYFHQDTAGEVELLFKKEDKDSFTQAVVWLLKMAGLQSYDSGGGPEPLTFVDSSHPESLPLLLEPDRYADKFAFNLRIDWERL